MGMAASQARFLGITARKTNTEYEGQQVNQQRTALANQSANLFNQMLALEVPSPPSKSDSRFTKTVYSFIDDTAEKATIQSIVNNPDPSTNATYPKIVKYTTTTPVTKSYRNSLMGASNKNTKLTDGSNNYKHEITVGNVTTELSRIQIDKSYFDDQNAKSVIQNTLAAEYLKAHPTATAEEIAEYYNDQTKNLKKFTLGGKTYYVNTDKTFTNTPEDDTKVPKTPATASITSDTALRFFDADGKEVTVPDMTYPATGATSPFTYTISGSNVTDLNAIDSVDDYDLSITDMENISYIKKAYNALVDETTFYKYTISGVDYYIPNMDTNASEPGHSADWNKDAEFQIYNKASYPARSEFAYGYYAKGINENVDKEYPAQVTYDASGRLQTITLKEGENVLTFNVAVNSITDEDAYEDAFNEYKYKMAQYEKEVEDINAKCKAIQEQDRTLELRLKQLDTEQEALTQEMDAIKKVIDKNVETTFKTFA